MYYAFTPLREIDLSKINWEAAYDKNGNELPLVKQKTNNPHWQILRDCANSGIYCSACNKLMYARETKPKNIYLNYCPNCGAKMAPWEQAEWL